MLDEVLRNTPAYQRILKEGRDEGLEEGLEKGIEKGLEKGLEKGRQDALQQELRRQHAVLQDIVKARFPRIVQRAKKQINVIEDPEKLSLLIIKMTTVPTAEEAQQLILDASEEEEQD